MRNRLTAITLLLAFLLLPELFAAGIEAQFTQVRRLKELGVQITFRGFMRCEPGRRLKWAVREPVASVTLIEADKLTHYDVSSRKTSVIDSARLPVLRLLNTCLTGWLTGDAGALAKLSGDFDIRHSGNTLLLTPSTAAGSWLKSVKLILAGKTAGKPSSAERATVEKVEITEASGDIIEIRFHSVKHDPVWSQADWKLDLK